MTDQGSRGGGIQSARRVGGLRTYRSITIEVTPGTAQQLDNILTHVQGAVTAVVCSPEDSGPRKGDGEIHPDLRELGALDVGALVPGE